MYHLVLSSHVVVVGWSAVHFSALVISCTWSIGSCILSEVMGALDRQSAPQHW